MTLIVRPIQAVLTRDTNFFTSMDPYCFFYLGDQVRKTSPHFGGGTKPVWGQVLKFNLGGATKMGVEVWAKSLIGGDSLVGYGVIDLNKMKIGNRPTMEDPIEIYFENQLAGKIILEMQIVPQVRNSQISQIQQSPQNQSAISQQHQGVPQVQNLYGNMKNMVGNDFGRGSEISQFQGNYIAQNPMASNHNQAMYDVRGSRSKSMYEGVQNNPHLMNIPVIQNPELARSNQLMRSNSSNQVGQQNMNYFNQQAPNNMPGPLYGSQISQPTFVPIITPVMNQPLQNQLEQFNQSSQIQENNAFSNINNLGGISGNQQPNAVDPLQFRGSLRGSQFSGLREKTPVKSILNNKSLEKENNRAKSPGKRVQFIDEV